MSYKNTSNFRFLNSINFLYKKVGGWWHWSSPLAQKVGGISCRGEGGTFAGGCPFLTRFPRGRGMNILHRCRGGRGIPFLHTHIQKQNMAKCPFTLRAWMPLSRDSPLLSWKASGTLGGGYCFLDRESWGGGAKIFKETPRGDMHFLRALFPKSTTPPPKKQVILNSPLVWRDNFTKNSK